MQSKKLDNKWLLRFDPGEEIMEGLRAFCVENNVSSGALRGLGACRRLVTGLYDAGKAEYIRKEYKGEFEIISLLGNITRKEGDIFIHAHICFGDEEMRANAGHCFECEISATCEIVIDVFDAQIERTFKPEIGLHTMDLA